MITNLMKISNQDQGPNVEDHMTQLANNDSQYCKIV